MIGNFWKMRTGRTEGGRGADGRWMGCRADGMQNRGRWADKSGRGTDRADEWQSERTGRGLGLTGGQMDKQGV